MGDQTPKEQPPSDAPVTLTSEPRSSTSNQKVSAQTEPSKDNKANPTQANAEPCPSCGNTPGHKFSCPKLERNCVMPLGMRKGTKSGVEKKEG